MDKKLFKNTASDVREISIGLLNFMAHYEKEALTQIYRLVKVMGPRDKVLMQVIKEINYTETLPLARHMCTTLDAFINLHEQAVNQSGYIFSITQLKVIKSLKNKLVNYDNYMQTATAADNFQNLLLSHRLELRSSLLSVQKVLNNPSSNDVQNTATLNNLLTSTVMRCRAVDVLLNRIWSPQPHSRNLR